MAAIADLQRSASEKAERIMPGPTSDSRDPEFGTAENAALVRKAIQETCTVVNRNIDMRHREILDVVKGLHRKMNTVSLTDKELRIIRFALDYVTDTI
jgi:hypothetical protein